MAEPRAYRKLLDLLSADDKRRGLIVLSVMLLHALTDTAGVASLLPFLAVLGNPDQIHTTRALRWAYEAGGFRSTHDFLFALGVTAFILVVVSSIISLATTYSSTRFVQMRRHSLGTRLLQAYLRQPYEFFLNRNSADLSKTILSEVDTVVVQVLKPAMDLLSYGLVTIVIILLLVVVNPTLAAVITLVVGGAYGGIYLTIRRLLLRVGAKRLKANAVRFKAAGEVFGGIKDLKVLGREQAYLTRFQQATARFSRQQYIQATLSAAPKYLIEAVGFGGILALTLVLMATRNDLGQVLPLIGLYAFAGYRLLPAAQQIYASISTLRFGWAGLELIHGDLRSLQPTETINIEAGDRQELHQAIRFEAVEFSYPSAERPALKDVNLTIRSRSSVGFVGSTGAGKTTAVDLILGLLKPTHGRILVDGVSLADIGGRRWQRAIGYVPQSIFLADASVSENIAFGIEPRRIDQEAVVRAAKIANIHDFVVQELKNGYATEVGERGVRLSGGQRQRIGIARALYHDPSVLVLDEATSALDTATERAVMSAVDALSGQKTIIIIAHRMSTVERCDTIVVLNCGSIVGAGSYADLRATNPYFQTLTAG
jgi:ABC-type multidrug transport system fused ATPase/permease subunit